MEKSNFLSTKMVDLDKIINLRRKIKFKTIIPEQYWGYLNVFNENEINQLPPIREKKPQNRAVEKRKEKTNCPLGPVIQQIKKLISGIEENIDRIFG